MRPATRTRASPPQAFRIAGCAMFLRRFAPELPREWRYWARVRHHVRPAHGRQHTRIRTSSCRFRWQNGRPDFCLVEDLFSAPPNEPQMDKPQETPRRPQSASNPERRAKLKLLSSTFLVKTKDRIQNFPNKGDAVISHGVVCVNVFLGYGIQSPSRKPGRNLPASTRTAGY
jgi:hypothetical protein